MKRRVHALVLLILLWAPAANGVQAGPHKRVMALYWYGKDFVSNVDFDRGLRAAFQTTGTEYHAEYFEPNQFPGDLQAIALRDYLQRKYSDRRMDVVIAMSVPAADFLLKYRDDLFPTVPIVFHAVNRTELNQRGAGSSGVIPDNAQAQTLDLALRFHRSTEHVFVINGTIEKDKYVETVLKGQFKGLEGKVPITYLTDLPLDELLSRVRKLPDRSVIFFAHTDYEEPGVSLSITDVLSLVADVASAPIYSSGSFVGYGTIGGYATNTYECGIQAGRMALRIMNGEPPDKLGVVEVPSIPIFDWRQLQRRGISADKLPPGSEIRYRELTAFEKYKWQILSGLALFVFQLLLIAGLLTERRKRRLAAEELQLLSSRLQDAQEQERRRIARELHDGTAQNLCAVLFNLEKLESKIDLPVNLQKTVSDCKTVCAEALNEIRTVSYILHPPVLDLLGLNAALRGYVEGFSRRAGIDVKLTATPEIEQLPQKIQTDLFRVVQECLANVHRHSGSPTAQVQFELRTREIVLRVADQGHGMPALENGVNPKTPGVGLSGIAQRLRYLGGHMEIKSNTHGTTVTVIVPVPGEQGEQGEKVDRSLFKPKVVSKGNTF
jgi:signal transduction histidine kinase